MVYRFSEVYLIFFILLAIAEVIIAKIRLSKKQMILLWVLFVFSLSVLAYNYIPTITSDLYRHFEWLNQIRGSEISFLDLFFNNENFVGGYEYRYMLTFNFFRYLVVSITENNHWLPAICVLIDYSILGYIVIDWSSENADNYKLDIFTLLLCFTLLPFVHAASGMRNFFSACVMGLAVYLYLYKNKKLWVFILLAFIAFTMHPAAMITIPFVILAHFNIGLGAYILVFIISALALPLAKYLLNSKYDLMSAIAKKFFDYTTENQFRGNNVPLYGVIIITAIFLIIYFMFYQRFTKNNNNSKNKRIYNFLAIYMVYILGNIGNYDMVLRPAYVLGALAPVLGSFLSDKNIWLPIGKKVAVESILNALATVTVLIICCVVNFQYLYYTFKNFFH